ncbi:MAG: beta-N-acetylhexosaminidase, partial [Enterobacteriaceae bacterium]
AIGERAFAADPVAALPVIRQFIAGMQAAGMACVGKHFPGHGSIRVDSHYETPVDSRSLEEIESHDLLPFRQLITENLLAGMMPAHVIYDAVDPLPASCSPYWLQHILRQELRFTGLVFSDDLSMKGANVMGSYPERAQAALQAGCDMILVCNNQQGAVEILDNLPEIMVDNLDRLYHRNTITRGQLLSTTRWQQAQEQLVNLAQRWTSEDNK